MEKTLAFAISALLICFGNWVFVVGLSSHTPVLLAIAAVFPIAIGFLSAIGPK
jgi:hypothetical protein